MNIQILSVGSDPEAIVVDRHGIPYPSVGLLGGSKEEPRKTAHGSISEDNVLAEFNSKPSKTRKQFIEHHGTVINDLQEILDPLDLKLRFDASAIYKDEYLKTKQAMEFGCEPDYNAWTKAINPKPSATNINLRSAGGHLHINYRVLGVKGITFDSRVNLVRVLDSILGVSSVIMDGDTRRRELYGKAGANRPKYRKLGHPYDGVEYRVLSNFWLKSPELMGFVWDQLKIAESRYEEICARLEWDPDFGTRIQLAINNSDKSLAHSILDELNIEV